MQNRIRAIFFLGVLAVLGLLTQATPVDVNGDGDVGPHEVIDLAESWKGPALQQGGQPWKIDGNNIFYDAGNVGVGGAASVEERLLVTGESLIGTAAFVSPPRGPHASHIHYESTGDWYIRSATSAGKVILQDTGGKVGIGTTTPQVDTLLNVVTDGVGIQAIRGNSPNGNGVIGTNERSGFSATGGVNYAADGAIGVYGEANTGGSSRGVWGQANEGTGVYGTSATPASGSAGVFGVNTANNGNGVIGEAHNGASAYGVWGRSNQGIGVYGSSSGTGAGRAGVVGVGETAGEFFGDVVITGTLIVGANAGIEVDLRVGDDLTVAGDIINKIDHPLDPVNKYLSHSSVESSEMKNIYDGIIMTDDHGFATVILPDWFEAFNTDFRYQLTVLDETNGDDFLQAKVVKKIKENKFTIRTSRPNVEVSWQVTGVRNDAYAKAHPVEVEKMKSDEEKGKYLAPELFGQPEEKGIHYRPELAKAKPEDPVSKE